MSLAKKLNLKDGATIRVLRKPPDVDLGDVRSASHSDAVLLFARTLAELDATAAPLVDAAQAAASPGSCTRRRGGSART